MPTDSATTKTKFGQIFGKFCKFLKMRFRAWKYHHSKALDKFAIQKCHQLSHIGFSFWSTVNWSLRKFGKGKGRESKKLENRQKLTFEGRIWYHSKALEKLALKCGIGLVVAPLLFCVEPIENFHFCQNFALFWQTTLNWCQKFDIRRTCAQSIVLSAWQRSGPKTLSFFRKRHLKFCTV